MSNNYQRIEDMSTAQSLTIPDSDDDSIVYGHALIQAEGGDVRVLNNDVAPTSTTGVLLTDGDSIVISERLAEVKLWAANSTPNANIIYGRGDTPPMIVIA